MTNYLENYNSILSSTTQIACKIEKDYCPSLIVVTKNQNSDAINEILKNSQQIVNIGESYIQEFFEKKELLYPNFTAHFIGHLQSNKAKSAVALFDAIHSVDSLKLAKLINKEAKKINKIQKIFLQINISNDPNKSGYLINNLESDIYEINLLENICFDGFMCITYNYKNPDLIANDYKKMSEIRDFYQTKLNKKLFLSMGMSNDYAIAIKYKTDFVRIGTAIFRS